MQNAHTYIYMVGGTPSPPVIGLPDSNGNSAKSGGRVSSCINSRPSGLPPLDGAAFRRARNERKMSQADVAKSAGVSRGFVAAIEQGRRQPSFEKRKAMLRAIGLDPAVIAVMTDERLKTKQRRRRRAAR